MNGVCTANPTSCQFTDDPLVAGTVPIKAVHIAELRACVSAQRTRFLLPLFVYTDGNLTNVSVKAVHILELRAALLGAYLAAAKPAPVYTDATLTAQQTVVKAVHIQELRAAILAIQ